MLPEHLEGAADPADRHGTDDDREDGPSIPGASYEVGQGHGGDRCGEPVGPTPGLEEIPRSVHEEDRQGKEAEGEEPWIESASRSLPPQRERGDAEHDGVEERGPAGTGRRIGGGRRGGSE